MICGLIEWILTNDLMQNYLRDLNGYKTLKRCKFRTKEETPPRSQRGGFQRNKHSEIKEESLISNRARFIITRILKILNESYYKKCIPASKAQRRLLKKIPLRSK